MIESAGFEDAAKIISLAEEMPVPPEGITSRTIFKAPFARVVLFSRGARLTKIETKISQSMKHLICS